MLIVNPFATSTTAAGRDALVNMLSARLDVVVEHTTHRGHAGELAIKARTGAFDVVIVHGGDGTVNEVVNGLLPSADDTPDSTLADDLPALAVLPGGSANVFARALGIDPDPLRSAAQLVSLLGSGHRRRVSLGHANGRWFLFNAGLGVDAEVVAEIEQQRRAGKKATPMRYVWATTRAFLTASRRTPALTVTVPGEPVLTGVHFAFVSNSTPWTFLGNRPIETNPGTDFDGGLGVFACRSMNPIRNTPLFLQLLSNRTPRGRQFFRTDDVAGARISADTPTEMQMDGEHLGPQTDVVFGHRPAALLVVAPDPHS
ncbi:Diacylglycerol kinase family enzyme [Williamsia sterculiae]|uniref:Diacylglycerol kinase family enzyme n=2 Tax=Williamsia sterculiae TaxID=1344003 RepID=A0A1N7FYR7_9NOCA|nr:Diacylglycerol kinase family enzyme [Williamsia sterculiae]